MLETVYPLLPRSAGDVAQFARHATLFVQVLQLVAIPGAVFIGMEGQNLSRLLYGMKWIAADPSIWPATLAALGLTLFSLYQSVLLAMSKLRTCFTLTFLLHQWLFLLSRSLGLAAGWFFTRGHWEWDKSVSQ